MDYEFAKDPDGNKYLKVKLSDYELLLNPLLNKGMAFPSSERDEFNLWGLLPPSQIDLSIQLQRSYEAFQNKPTELEKYIYLRDLQDSNETLFYKLLTEHIEELMPIVYTPVVGLGCQRYSHIYRRPRGIFISYANRYHIEQILSNPRFDRVKVIVVSDGERILGLGDQGAGGMGIPIGKLSLYTACAGIHPGFTLPVLLDTGTNNIDLQKDPLYIGWQHDRIRDEKYHAFVDLFVTAVKKRFPHILLQWEDFARLNANPLLERYRDQLCSFNDDIQGTAAIAAGTLFSAIKVTQSKLCEQRIVIVGGGSAGCGIGHLIKQAMMDEGCSENDARQKIYIVDRAGLFLADMHGLESFQKEFTHSRSEIAQWQLTKPNEIHLLDVVRNVQPTLLVGVSGQGGVFTEEIVREMAQHVDRPIILPLSNPTANSEAKPSDLLRWTNERAIIGTGSPFGTVEVNGVLHRIDQTNNCYIFPGLGLGLIAVKAKTVTDRMLMKAAKALAECSPAKTHTTANILPRFANIRQVSLQVAVAVANEAIESGVADYVPDQPIEKYLADYMWVPEYLPYRR